tara:strand:- start:1373 stop:2257 length:885 start_codon:yes stop_codon:yes gene_type:complete
MVKRGKLPKLRIPALGGLTKNKYVLYLLLIVGLVNVIGYLQTNNLDSLGLFLVSGVLAAFFTKNMIVILAIAILMGTCKTCTSYFSLGGILEGADETLEEEEDEEDEEDEGFIGFREGFKEGAGQGVSKKKAGKKKKGNSCKKVYRLVKASKGKKCKESCKKNCASGDAYCGKNQSTCEGKEKFGNRTNVPSSEPAALDDGEGDEAGGKRIDYAATLEMAYDNLDKMLGKKGMKGLTQETSKLAKQQKGLMESLKNMAPIMKNAKSTLESMNLPEINKMAAMMQNINQGKTATK